MSGAGVGGYTFLVCTHQVRGEWCPVSLMVSVQYKLYNRHLCVCIFDLIEENSNILANFHRGTHLSAIHRGMLMSVMCSATFRCVFLPVLKYQ